MFFAVFFLLHQTHSSHPSPSDPLVSHPSSSVERSSSSIRVRIWKTVCVCVSANTLSLDCCRLIIIARHDCNACTHHQRRNIIKKRQQQQWRQQERLTDTREDQEGKKNKGNELVASSRGKSCKGSMRGEETANCQLTKSMPNVKEYLYDKALCVCVTDEHYSRRVDETSRSLLRCHTTKSES